MVSVKGVVRKSQVGKMTMLVEKFYGFDGIYLYVYVQLLKALIGFIENDYMLYVLV